MIALILGIIIGIYLSVGVGIGWEQYQPNVYADPAFKGVPDWLYSVLLVFFWVPIGLYLRYIYYG